jgi:hypothetical protein
MGVAYDQRRKLAAAVSFASAMIHLSASIHHFSEYWLFGTLFLVAAAAEIAWSARAWRHGSPALLVAGAALQLGVAVVWVWSRTTGLPIGPEAGEAEGVGALDVQSTVDELLTVLLVALLLPRLSLGRSRVLVTAVEVLAILALPASFLIAGSGAGHAS